MTIAAQTALAVGRATFVGALALALAGKLTRWINGLSGRRRWLAWTLLMGPFLTPSLLISYGYSHFVLALSGEAWGREGFYLAILTLRLTPVAVLVRHLLPTSLSPEGRHAYSLMRLANWSDRLRFRWAAAELPSSVAFALVFLLAFSDFELASLWSMHSWTIALFDAQAGSLALRETVRMALGPVAVELLVLVFLFQMRVAASRRGIVAGLGRISALPPARWSRADSRARIPWAYLWCAAAAGCLLPVALVAAPALAGFHALTERFVLGGSIAVSLCFALATTGGTTFLASCSYQRLSGAVLAVAGLFGTMLISLVVLWAFQLAPLRSIYDTPAPLILALILTFFPTAFLLRLLHGPWTSSRHLAREMHHPRLAWELEMRPRCAMAGVLFCFAYFDFTAGSMLAPVGLTPVFVRLHNLAHYGQNAILSAMLLVSFSAPILTWLLGCVALRQVANWRAVLAVPERAS